MRITQKNIYIIGIHFRAVFINGKIQYFNYSDCFFLKKWLKEAKNYFFSKVLTIGQGSGLINVSGKRLSMTKRLCLERIDYIEAQTWYKPYSKLHYIRKKIEKLEKTV